MMVAVLTCMGCATWQATSAKVLSGLTKAGVEAHAFVVERCGRGGVTVAKACLAAKDPKCAPLRACEKAVRAIHSLQTAVLVGKLAVQVGAKPKAEAAVAAALKAMGPVAKAVKGWVW